jgi:nicotinate-nucleotide adenylyltransferase
MNTGLFFGSFNPIHQGHLIVAQSVLEFANLHEVWFVVSPQNPLKKNKNLLHEFDRLDMVNLAIKDNDRFRASDIEFQMPRPSYTIDTLAYLREKYPNKSFKLIIGGDNLDILPRNIQIRVEK